MDCIVFICESSCLAFRWQVCQHRISATSRSAGKKLGLFSTGRLFNILAHFEDTSKLPEYRRHVNTLFATFLQLVRQAWNGPTPPQMHVLRPRPLPAPKR
jgi:hypothetical protein